MKSQNPIVLAVDFDETIVKSNFPAVVRAKRGAVKYLRRLNKKGFYIIIWTCRHGEHESLAYNWLMQNNIPFNQLNKHHPILPAFYGNDTRKISADIYIDDKSLLFLFHPTWLVLYYLIRLRSLFIKRKILDECE